MKSFKVKLILVFSIGLLIFFISMRFLLGFPMRELFIYTIFPSIEGLLLIALLIFMAYVLDKKRKLATR